MNKLSSVCLPHFRLLYRDSRRGKLCVRLSPWQPVYAENKDPLELSDDDDKLAYRALTMCWALFWVLIRLIFITTQWTRSWYYLQKISQREIIHSRSHIQTNIRVWLQGHAEIPLKRKKKKGSPKKRGAQDGNPGQFCRPTAWDSAGAVISVELQRIQKQEHYISWKSSCNIYRKLLIEETIKGGALTKGDFYTQ